jgi:hypothetical protein
MRRKISMLVATALIAAIPAVGSVQHAGAAPNPVATTEAEYQAYGRVFPDPHGCLAYGVPDSDGNGVKDTPRGISPWAKGRMCADQFLQYQEVIEGAKFLESRFPEFIDVIRLDQAYDNPNFRSAGIPRGAVIEDGEAKVLGRDRRPLYMIKVTDSTSSIPEREREHFVYSLSIHGIERAGVEGGVRAIEDLVTWAACEVPDHADAPPCADEGPFPKKLIETPTSYEVPTAGEVLDRSVSYFILPNPDGWARGQVAPIETRDGNPNVNYAPGFFFQRYNGNGVDLNRDWPTKGYTFRPYSPGSEPETKAFADVLSGIKETTAAKRFTGGIDLHGMITAHAFSYTLIGAGQRDYRKNAVTVDTSIRTWEDQTQRMSWSPYVADANANGVQDEGETCVEERVLGGGTRGRIPACVADEWGTVIDTLGYQITGGIGDWIDSDLGLNGVGIDNEMYASHLAPNTVFEPALEQTHIDGNKGLIFSQLAAMLTEGATSYDPPGKIGYVFNPERLQIPAEERPQNPGLPAQNDIEVVLPCADGAPNSVGACDGGTFAMGAAPTFEFDVKSPADGFFNAGITVEATQKNALGVSDGNFFGMQLQHQDEGQWHTVAEDFNQSFAYAQAGRIITANDPQPGRWRIVIENASELPMRVRIDFENDTAEHSPGQAAIDASSMDFFEELNEYVPDGEDLARVTIEQVLAGDLPTFDTIVLVNSLGSRRFLIEELGMDEADVTAYFAALKDFVQRGGNLVLTDAALQALSEFGLVTPDAVQQGNALVGNYNFQIAEGVTTYEDPATYPLATDVKKPGTAEQTPGRRQAVEPVPLGYTPDTGMDRTPLMPFWGVDRTQWEAVCGLPNCTTATTTPNGTLTNLGEAALGEGRIRLGGILLPDPVFEEDAGNDHRFGLASYALTYTSYEVFENVVVWTNPNRVDEIASSFELSCGDCIFSGTGGKVNAQVRLANTGGLADSYTLRVVPPRDWRGWLKPQAANLDAGQERTVNVTLVPKGARPGNYTAFFEAEASDGTTKAATLRIAYR